MRLTDSVLLALARLERDADFQQWLSHIEAARTEALAGLQQATDLLNIGRLQGEAMTLGTLLEQAAGASTVVTERQRRQQ